MFKISQVGDVKMLSSDKYNYMFNTRSGFFARWGTTFDDDPDYSPFGPEIADIEISSANVNDIERGINFKSHTVVDGGCNGCGCKKFCYKGNTGNKTVNMSVDFLSKILDKMPETLTQVAYGICSVSGNPHLWEIFQETRNREIIPNVTINGVGITDEHVKKLCEYCGAVAVSVNEQNIESAYNTIKKLTDCGMSQVNIHVVFGEESGDFIKNVAYDIKNDARLSDLNAIVMLAFKDKQKTCKMSQFSSQTFNDVIRYVESLEINYGFDSCTAHTFLRTIKGRKDSDKLSQCIEPCESGLFSIYVNVFGEIFACSFCENVGFWQSGYSILEVDDFWNCDKMREWRKYLLSRSRKCPFYKIGV